MVYVIKMDGTRAEFDKNRIVRTARRAGAPQDLARAVANEVELRVYDGMTTKEILSMVKELLRKHDPYLARIYTLKDAINSLNPDLYEFEYYMASLFRIMGYDAIRSPEPKPRGKCVEHEIDVVIKKDGVVGIVECKHHHKERTFTGLDVVMRQRARLEDLRDGYKARVKNSINPAECWVVTNTKFSEHAIRYARCRGIKLLSWNYPNGNSLADIVNRTRAFPLTIINVPLKYRAELLRLHVANTIEMARAKDTLLERAGMSSREIKIFKNRANKIMERGTA